MSQRKKYVYRFKPEHRLHGRATVMATVEVFDRDGNTIGIQSFSRQPKRDTPYGRRQIEDMVQHIIRDHEYLTAIEPERSTAK